jgi:hypothetical protein
MFPANAHLEVAADEELTRHFECGYVWLSLERCKGVSKYAE